MMNTSTCPHTRQHTHTHTEREKNPFVCSKKPFCLIKTQREHSACMCLPAHIHTHTWVVGEKWLATLHDEHFNLPSHKATHTHTHREREKDTHTHTCICTRSLRPQSNDCRRPGPKQNVFWLLHGMFFLPYATAFYSFCVSFFCTTTFAQINEMLCTSQV